MLIAQFDSNGNGVVVDSYSQQHAPPPSDVSLGGVNNVLSYNVFQSGGATFANWTRYLVTGDSFDWPVTNESITVIWAYGSSNTFGYHGNNRGTAEVNLITGMTPPPDLSVLELPPGFEISIFTQAIGARNMAFSTDQNIVYVGSGGGSIGTTLYAFSLNDPSHVIIMANDLNNPNGVAWYKGSLFIATITAVTRYDNIDYWFTQGTLPPKGVVLMTFEQPPAQQHQWKTVKIGPDGLVYTSVNSPCNTCNDTGLYGSIIRFSPVDGSGMEVIAHGIRDMQGLDWAISGDLFWSDNGRDELGNYWPPDEFNWVPLSQLQNPSSPPPHYGFPYCYGQNEPDQTANPSLNCLDYTPAIINLPAHIAALGVLYYRGNSFPAPYQNNFFVAAHGSWNRQPPLFSQLLFVEIDPVTGQTMASVFLRGFGATGVPSARLVAPLQLPDGSILVSDDLRGYIYQIRYVGFSQSQKSIHFN